MTDVIETPPRSRTSSGEFKTADGCDTPTFTSGGSTRFETSTGGSEFSDKFQRTHDGSKTPNGAATAGCDTVTGGQDLGMRWTDPTFKELVEAWNNECDMRKQRVEKMHSMTNTLDDSIASLKHLLADCDRRAAEARDLDTRSESSETSSQEGPREGKVKGPHDAKLKRMDSLYHHRKRLSRPKSAPSPAMRPQNDGKKHLRFSLKHNMYVEATNRRQTKLPTNGKYKCAVCEAVYTARSHLLRHMKYCEHAHQSADMALPDAMQLFHIPIPPHVSPAQIDDRQDEWEEQFELFFDFEGMSDKQLEVVGDKFNVAKLILAIENLPSTLDDMKVFSVTFYKKPFGIYTVPGIHDKGIIVEDVPLPCGKHAYENGVRRNMLVCEINGRNIEQISFDSAMKLLKNATLPVILSFRRDLGSLVLDSDSSNTPREYPDAPRDYGGDLQEPEE